MFSPRTYQMVTRCCFRSLGWNCSWTVQLTDAGRAACREFHLPAELLAGAATLPAWDWQEAVQNFAKMSVLLDSSTISEQPGEFDAGTVNLETPAREEPKKRVPKRKLN